ncbi:HigA family addiction module antidote protein [Rhodomicrobium vannielii ATCC 17100]|uniref:HigA family addiction module antitoxin n=1 Tax=Rhodomicrobium vannielii TaxID=1069 RepID=UPI001917E8D0|nr:HigA family addiction module antitoxin [Rhodomicrobium vannielii]MBJ7533262.1 HigA family addiction module antidote protein [Rhodomicrobium vannielii ATCC 17100]
MVDEAKQGLPFRPPHPGEVLREDILPALGMTVKELAEHLGVTRQTLSGLLHERRAVSVDTAQRLGQAFRNGARFWLALQMQRDLWEADQSKSIAIKPLRWERDAA